MKQVEASKSSPSTPPILDLTDIIAGSDWIFLSLINDFLYTSHHCLTLPMLRYYALMLFFHQLDQQSIEETEQISLLEGLLKTYFFDVSASVASSSITTNIYRHPEDLLQHLCKDKVIWRDYQPFVHTFTRVGLRVHHLAILLHLPAFASKCEALLVGILNPYNIHEIVTWTYQYHRRKAIECCLKYMTIHAEVIRCPSDQLSLKIHIYRAIHHQHVSYDLPAPYPEIIQQLILIIQHSSIPVLSKEMMRIPKYHELFHETPPFNQHHAEQMKAIANLCVSEEMPIASEVRDDDTDFPPSATILMTSTDSKQKTLAVALPKMVGHSVGILQNQSLLFFGGMNRERYYSLSRLLSYNVAEDRFYWTLNDASRAPINVNFCHTFPLQKYRATRFVLIGGKLKDEVMQQQSNNNTDLPMKKKESLLQQYQAEELNLLRYLMEEERPQQTQSVRHAEGGDGKEKASNRLHKRTKSTHNIVLEDYADGKGIPHRDKIVNQDCDATHEFHASSLTWIRRCLRYYTGTPIARNRTIFDGMMTDSQLAMISELKKAFKRRVAQAFVPVFASDIPYRCPKCLFLDRIRAAHCSCRKTTSKGTAAAAASSATPEKSDKEIVTWGIQFGGYCAQDDEIMNDIHVLYCRNQPFFFAEKEVSSATTTSTAQAPGCEYEWTKLPIYRPASMPEPVVRFGHQGVFIPGKKPSEVFLGVAAMETPSSLSTTESVAATARMFFFGGASYHDLTDSFLSLRFLSKDLKDSLGIDEDCMWEPHRRVTGSPTNRHDHSMTYIPEGNFCLLYGGLISTGHGNVCMNDLWSLHWYFSEIDELTLRWEKIRTAGIPPSPRSRHVACYFPHQPQQKNRIEALHSSHTNC